MDPSTVTLWSRSFSDLARFTENPPRKPFFVISQIPSKFCLYIINSRISFFFILCGLTVPLPISLNFLFLSSRLDPY
ncbi:hypothetical protein L6452_12036 [Arctium lappa]|uniref:Uncharacterized protein n=1 Tax=Arctium lappa TaxID=4217 RepID=A0ACB9DQM9_ARCLA|nr:hypothetical protein L6452_12036 [Arctium lappa]